MSTPDQLLYSALHGTAVRYAAEKRNLAASIDELRETAGGRDDILAEAAGITAGSWYANPPGHVGHELIAAGMLILAGGGCGVPVYYVELERWTRVGFEIFKSVVDRRPDAGSDELRALAAHPLRVDLSQSRKSRRTV
jgi:hypothetical protein